MKKTKKLCSIFIASCMLFGLASCGTTPVKTAESKAPALASAAASAGKSAVSAAASAGASAVASAVANKKSNAPIKVAYIAKNTVDAFHAKVNAQAKTSLDALVADGTIESWQLYDGLTDPVTQNNLLEDAINQGANLVIMLPAEAAGCAPMVQRCKDANISCIVVNSKTDNTDDLATAFVGSDDVQAGEMMAKFIQKQVPNGGGYGHIQGIIGNSAQIDRGKGLHNVLDADSKWKMLDEQGADWQAEKAVKFGEDWLTKYGTGLNAIICDNDDMSSAVQNSMNAAGRKDIVCIGVDGNKGALTMVKNGDLLATVYQDGAAQVKKGIEIGIEAAQGKTVPKSTMIDFVLVANDNVASFLK